MELPIAHAAGADNAVNVPGQVFDRAFNQPLVHQVVTAYLAGGRQGSKAQKSRSQVRGGGRKPWRQKGTGRARAGTIRSPIWRGGGVTFAAQPRSYQQKVNKKMYRGAMCAILSELVRQERVMVIADEQLELAAPKTKELLSRLASLTIDQALLVTHQLTTNLYLAARNLPNVWTSDLAGLDPVSLVQCPRLVISVSALKQLGERLA